MCFFLLMECTIGEACEQHSVSGDATGWWSVLDMLYFGMVTMCALGYGAVFWPSSMPGRTYIACTSFVGLAQLALMVNAIVDYVKSRQEAKSKNQTQSTKDIDNTKKQAETERDHASQVAKTQMTQTNLESKGTVYKLEQNSVEDETNNKTPIQKIELGSI